MNAGLAMVLLRNYFLFILVCYSVIAMKNEYCYMDDPNPYLYFGAKTRYDLVRAKNIFVPTGCSPFYMWALIRHGTRYAIQRQWNLPKLTELRNEIILNHETHRRGTLCTKDLIALKNWDSKAFSETMHGGLTPQGKKEALNLAKRLKTTFPNFLPTKEKYDLKTSSAPRSQETGIAFTNEFFETSYSTVEGNMIAVDDELLRIHDNIDFTETRKPINAFRESKYMRQLIDDVSLRLGFERSLSYDEVTLMYLNCVYIIAWTLKEKSEFCVVFTPDHLKILEYLSDLEVYSKLGYGFPIVKNFYCPVIKDLVLKLSETIAPVATKLGLFQDEIPLASDTYEALQENRKWRTTFFDPFFANLIVIMYNCSSEHKVALYNNENIVKLPGCKETLCSLETLKEKLNNELTPKKCEIDPKYLWKSKTPVTTKKLTMSNANALQHRFWVLLSVNAFILFFIFYYLKWRRGSFLRNPLSSGIAFTIFCSALIPLM